MNTTYAARAEALQGELRTLRLELAQATDPKALAALRARERSILRSIRWYSARLTSTPTRRPVLRDRFEAASL